MTRASLPGVFRSLTTLRTLNVAAMGLSLAGATGAVLARFDATFVIPSALSTLVFGIAWGIVLRWRSTVGRSRVRWGWLASLPLAIGNAMVACAILFATMKSPMEGPALGAALVGAFLGLTFGALIWIPGLIATLVVFGIPIWWAQRLADRGLAGEERGERILGGASALVSLLSLPLTSGLRPGDIPADTVALLLRVLCVLGLVTGAAAIALAQLREGRRRAFVRDVAAGHVPGFRVDESDQGKVLVRITSMGEGYRVANFEEEIVSLTETGEAKELRERSLGARP